MNRRTRTGWLAGTRVAVAFAAMIGMVALSSPASAVPAAPSLKLIPNEGPPTSIVKAKGTGYPPGHQIFVSFDGTQVASATTGSTGKFTAKFAVPASAIPGNHTVGAFDPNDVGTTATFLVRVDWSNARYNPQNWGFNPYENVLNPSNVGQLVQISGPQWGGFLHSAPIYTGGTLVAGSDDGTVRAFDPTSGQQLWSFASGGPVLGSPVAVQRDPGPGSRCAIVAASQDTEMFGLNPANGQQIWAMSVGAPMSSSPVALVPAVQRSGGTTPAPTAVEDVVVAADDGSVHVVDGCTGAPVWADPTVGPGPSTTPAFLSGVAFPDGSKHDLVVASFGDGSVVALEASTGAELWSGKDPGPPNSPTAYGSGGKARIVLAAGPSIVELNAATGAQLWSMPTGGPASGVGLYYVPAVTSPSSPALKLSLRAVIATDQAGDVYALNPKTGSVLWGDRQPGPIGTPSIANGVVYVERNPGPQEDGQVIGLNASTGDPLFHLDLGSLNPQPLPPFPAIADGRVYAGDFTGGVRVFGLQG